MHTENSNWFPQTVIELGARVKILQGRIGGGVYADDVSKVEREINVCEAQLQMMYSHANLNNIDLSNYYTPFTEIKSSLELMKDKLQRRVVVRKMGFFARLFEGIGRILSVIGWVLFGSSRQLSEGNRPSGYLGY